MKKKIWSRFINRKKQSGFTLPELLIAIIIGGLVTITLLNVVVQIFQHDRREVVLSQTQQDMQNALDFITEDLRQSMFIYSDPTTVLNHLPAFDGTPVLVFWRLEQLYAPGDPLSRTGPGGNTLPGVAVGSGCSPFSGSQLNDCRVLMQKRFQPALIVYYLSTTPNPRYKGQARIMRYRLPRFSNPQTMTQSVGYLDPVVHSNFVYWPLLSGVVPSGMGTPTLAANVPRVLTDFVDSPTNLPVFPLTLSSLNCPSTSYTRRPPTALAASSTSFYVCVRDPVNDASVADVGINQDVFIYLRGSALGRDGIIKEDKILNAELNLAATTPILQARVTLRGVVDKFK